MPEKITAETILNNLMEAFAVKQKSVSFFEGPKSNAVSSQFNRPFGRHKPVHHLLGGGKSADVLLWRDKKISFSVFTSATAIWVLFEWLDYHFLSLVCLALLLGMLFQFLWANASGFLDSDDRSPRTPSKVPRLVVPEDYFVNIATLVCAEVNRGLSFLQDVACGRDKKQFFVVLGSLWTMALIASWFNFLTVIYIGFVAAQTLPVLYEKHGDAVDNFVYELLDELQNQYRKLDAKLQIPKGNHKREKRH